MELNSYSGTVPLLRMSSNYEQGESYTKKKNHQKRGGQRSPRLFAHHGVGAKKGQGCLLGTLCGRRKHREGVVQKTRR